MSQTDTINFPESFPTLETERLLLREMMESDVPAWFERLTDPESSHLSGDPMPDSPDICLQWLAGMRDMFRSQEGIRWAIEPIGRHASIGSIGLFDISPVQLTADMGTVIGRHDWNKGFVTEAGQVVLDYAFLTLHLKKVQADCLVDHHASQRVLEKLGFKLQSTIPQYRKTGDTFLPGLLFTLER